MASDPTRAGMSDWDAAAYAEQLVPGSWPTADVDALRVGAERFRDLARRVRGIGNDVDAGRRDLAGGRGIFADQLDAGLRRLSDQEAGTGGAGDVAGRLDTVARMLERYADTVVRTRQEMTVIAAITDRDSRRADVLALLGDESARVVVASSGRLALTAAGDDFTDRSEDAARHDAPPAATSGMMPFAPTGAMGALGAGALAGAAGVGAARSGWGSTAVVDTEDLVWLRRRADQVAASVGPELGGWLRTAVGLGRSDRGRRVVVVATSDPQPYQRRGMSLGDDEALAGDGRAPELAILDHMAQTGTTPCAVASAAPMAPATLAVLRAAEVEVLAPGAETRGV